MSLRPLFLCFISLLLGCMSFPVRTLKDAAGVTATASNTLDTIDTLDIADTLDANSPSRLASFQEDVSSKTTSIKSNAKPKPKPDPKPLIPRSLRPTASSTAIPTTELSSPTFFPTCIFTAYPTMNSTGVSSGSAEDAADTAAALSQSWFIYSVVAGLVLLLLVIFFLSIGRSKIFSLNDWEGVSNDESNERSAIVPSTSQCLTSYQATDSNQQYLLSPDRSEYKEVNYIR